MVRTRIHIVLQGTNLELGALRQVGLRRAAFNFRAVMEIFRRLQSVPKAYLTS